MGGFLDVLLHIDKHLEGLITQYGPVVHLFLFAVIFLETGLVVMPFLPGDSLLFASGLLARENGFNIYILLTILPLASVLGDTLNFHIGKYLGKPFLTRFKFFKPEWLDKTREFYDKHGAKTIIIGRFVPIVRTVAPFVAGLDAMPYRRYLPLCVAGSILWVWLCAGAGFILGQIPAVKENFEITLLIVIFASVFFFALEIWREKLAHKRAEAKRTAAEAQSDAQA